jgi:hypothetical protein
MLFSGAQVPSSVSRLMFERFLEQIRSDAYDSANEPEAGDLRLTALLETLLSRLEEAGAFADSRVAFFRREGPNLHAEVHGYSVDTEDDVLTLFNLVDANEIEAFGSTWTPRPVAKEVVDRAFRRLESFVKLVRSGKRTLVEESQPAAELVDLVQECLTVGRTVALCVLVTGPVSERAAALAEGNESLHHEVWELVRLARICGGAGDEPVCIDFAKDFGCTLPCLITPRVEDDIQVLLTSVPGSVVAAIYNSYRARLLERNVRSFLQFTGKVNKGIRETLLTAPSRFLPYNNGLSATAASVQLEQLGDGVARISRVDGFQIVNGGQTTASIAAAARRDDADLRAVAVAMKLTVVPASKVDQLVPLISRFANTQNRIQEADFSANHPWHVTLERLSRDTWTEPTLSAPRGTRWYYERSRGQYADEVGAVTSQAARKRFRAENPPRQRFTKTDLAKVVLSWDQRPQVVSRGAQKCFVEFMLQLTRQEKALPDKEVLKRIAAQAILFHTAAHMYGSLGFQGYRAQVVTYAVARLSRELERRLPWDSIWENQEIPTSLTEPLKIALTGIREVIVSPPSGRNISEWCKKDDCWNKVLELGLQLGLPDVASWHPHAMFETIVASKPLADGALLHAIVGVPAEVWFSASKWAKDRGALLPWQRSLAFSLGRIVGQEGKPTIKQATQGRRLMLEAVDEGFMHDRLTSELVERIRTGIADF